MNGIRLLAFASIGVFAVGCGDVAADGSAQDEMTEIVENLIAAGFPENDIQIYDDRVYVGHDAHVTLEASREMVMPLEPNELDADHLEAHNLEQYRTRNLVSRNLDTICIDGRAFSGTLSTALNWSINNYNRLNLTFEMRRIGGNTSGCNAVITARVVGGGAGGSAGFPSGGRPYNIINIAAATANLGTNTAEHVITHELGHCVGFRHSDYFDRSISCGRGGNEGSGGVGAIYIQGTPRGARVGGSLMNSCFRSSETGEFTSSDRTALQALY